MNQKIRYLMKNKMSDRLKKVVDEWNKISDSEWYMSYRQDKVINEILSNPKNIFHEKTWEIIRQNLPNLEGKKVLVPSSGDNRAVFAFAALGADVTSCDICEKQLIYAKKIAEVKNLSIKFQVEDTMKLESIPSNEFDLVYTSEGVFVWIDDLNGMFQNIFRVLKNGGLYINFEIHPFTRPFAYDDGRPNGKEIRIRNDYNSIGPFSDGTEFHWRMQDILNSLCNSGIVLKHLEEMHDEHEKGHFWFYEEEREKMSKNEIDSYYDIVKNPLSALPQWFSVCGQKK